MEISPQHVRSMSFSTSKRGYDTAEVDSFVQEVAAALEAAQNDTTAMEARARAAVARLQELSQGADASPSGTAMAEPAQAEAAPADVHASVDETETISRTLLLAQRTADTTMAEAEAESERLLASARDDAAQSLDQARQMADQLVEDAKEEARRAGEGERVRVETEVQALNARRDFLESDVDQLEAFLIEQRERIRESATALTEIVERVPGGLGTMRRPLLSAAGEPIVDVDEDDTAPYDRPGTGAFDDDVEGGADDAGDRDLDDVDERDLDDLDDLGEDADVGAPAESAGVQPEGTDEQLPLDPDSTPSHTTMGERTVDERRW